MGWSVMAERMETADMISPLKPQKVIPNANLILIGVRTWVVLYNDPTYTSLKMEIWSNDGGSPGALIATSINVQLKADVCTLDNGIKEIWFEFDYVNLKDTDSYFFVLQANGYTDNWPTDGIAWRKGWPDPVYTTNVSTTYNSIGTSPYTLYLIGSEL